MPNKLRVLITGSRGLIGSALIRALRQDGHDVWGLDRTGDSANKILKADLLDAEEIHRAVGAVQPFSAIIHTAALGHGKPPPPGESVFSVNTRMTRNVLDATQEHQPHFLLLSSVSVYGEAGRTNPVRVGDALRPASAYGRSKLACEEMVLESPLKNCDIIRLAPVFSDTYMINARNRVFPPGVPGLKMLLIPSPDYSLCHLDTAVQQIRDVLDAPGRRILNVSDPRPYSQRQIASWFSGITLPVPVPLAAPIYWSTFLLPRRPGYALRCIWWKLFRSNVYINSPVDGSDERKE